MRKARITLFVFFILNIFILADGSKALSKEPQRSHQTEYHTAHFDYTIKHIYDPLLPLEFWVTTISPRDQISQRSMIKKAFGHDEIGRKETISHLAKRKNAIITINASGFYSNGDVKGLQIKDGIVFQKHSQNLRFNEVAIINNRGNLSIITGKDTFRPRKLIKNHVRYSFYFGPYLIKNGKKRPLKPSDDAYVVYKRHPRQGIGQKRDGTFVIITVDGRSKRSRGATIQEFIELFKKEDCINAYNLDGGGSAQTYINSKTLNHYSDGKERPVPDFLYISS